MTGIDSLQLGGYFRNRRNSLNMTIEQAAKVAGITPRTYIKVENNTNSVKLSTLKKIASILDYNLSIEIVYNLTDKVL